MQRRNKFLSERRFAHSIYPWKHSTHEDYDNYVIELFVYYLDSTRTHRHIVSPRTLFYRSREAIHNLMNDDNNYSSELCKYGGISYKAIFSSVMTPLYCTLYFYITRLVSLINRFLKLSYFEVLYF